MKLYLFRFLLIAELVVLCIASLVCLDDVCDPTGGVERCLGGVGYNQWLRFTFSPERETYFFKRRLLCDVMCFRRRCMCNLYLPDTTCILIFHDALPAASESVLRIMGTPLHLDALSSSTVLKAANKAVDGNMGSFFQSGNSIDDTLNWFQADLTTPHVIKEIRITGQTRFKTFEIYVSNDDAATGGIDSGTRVAFVPLSPINLGYWWNTNLEHLSDSYRYVIVVRSRQQSPTMIMIEINEIEILV